MAGRPDQGNSEKDSPEHAGWVINYPGLPRTEWVSPETGFLVLNAVQTQTNRDKLPPSTDPQTQAKK